MTWQSRNHHSQYTNQIDIQQADGLMPLRLMQIFIPEEAASGAEKFLEGCDLLGTWRDARNENRIVMHLLIPAEATEPITDRFEQAYADTDGFRVVLFPIEAVLPRPQEPPDKDPTATEENRDEKDAVRESARVAREELYADITETLCIDRVFIALTILSSIVAAVGLLRDDVAVIIGAMVIAPLLGPNMAMALATTLGDLDLLRKALFTNGIGIAVALLISLSMGILFTVDPNGPAIISRTNLVIGDLVLALAAGSAGTFAFTRGFSGAVIGVMVAVALMPPLVTVGMLTGAGYIIPALGALLLVTANIVCINLAGVATFLAQGVRPRSWWEGERAKKASYKAIAIWASMLLTLGVIIYLKEIAVSTGH